MAEKINKTLLQLNSASADLADGWSGRFALNDSAGDRISLEDWKEALADIDSLLSAPVEMLRDQRHSTVIRKDITIDGKEIAVVIKHERLVRGAKNYIRALRPAKAFRFFKIASRLAENGVPAVFPLAALQRKQGLLTTDSILITEYARQSEDLYWFMRNNTPSTAVKKGMCVQIATIFALLHKCDLRHCDAKAQNMLVTPVRDGDSCKISLLDLDGVKSCLVKTFSRRFRPLAKLAATLLSFGDITMMDYMRAFSIYCNLTDIDVGQRKRIFRKLGRRAVAIRLLTMARTAAASTEKSP
jgi:hypothetical protein